MLVIKHLSESKEHVDLVTDWQWKQWGDDKNYDYYKVTVEHSLSKTDLPQTFIAFMDGEPVATVGLWRCDLISRQDLYPWLASLYVEPEYRGKGIGTELQDFLIEYSARLGYEEIYLHTQLDDYYERTGWEYIANGVEHNNKKVKIYKIKTSSK